MSRHPFKIVEPAPSVHGRPYDGGGSPGSAVDRVRGMVTSADLFVFMKGTPAQPKCGFSANTVAILESYDAPFVTFDVLADEEIRAAAKEAADWPTYPQVWLRGEFIGGNDILTELHAAGELAKMLEGVTR